MATEGLRFPTEAHRSALEAVLAEADVDSEVIAVLVCGSIARGDGLPGSDLDLRLYLSANAEDRPFLAEDKFGIWVERSYRTIAAAQSRLETHPMEIYPYREEVLLRDTGNALAALRDAANERLAAYNITDAERTEYSYWLESTERKLKAACDAEDPERCGYLVATSSWPILTGLWLAANLPLPPSGAVLSNLAFACRRIPDLDEALVKNMFLARAPAERARAALVVLKCIRPHL